MLHAQVQQYLISNAPLVREMKASLHIFKFYVGCPLPREVGSNLQMVPVYADSESRGRRVAAVRNLFGSGLRRHGQGVRFPSSLRSSTSSGRVRMGSIDSAAQPLSNDNQKTNSAEDNPNHTYVEETSGNQYSSTIALSSNLPRSLRLAQLSVVDQVFLLLGLIACTTSFALFALIVTAIPTFNAMRRAAVSVEKLADIAREELPGTMAAIRLSGMEISDLTLELNDLSQEISEGVRNSARAVQAAEVGIRRIGLVAASQTIAMLQETANVPVQVVRPAVVSAAATTLHAVSQAQKLVASLASSSYPRISGWLGQRGSSGKRQKSVGETSSSTGTLTGVLTGQGTNAASLLSGGKQLSLFDDAANDESDLTEVPSGKDN